MTQTITAPRMRNDEIDRYFDPAQDPALIIPDYANLCGKQTDPMAPPSRDEIEAALRADILETVGASRMISGLFSPFMFENEYIPGLKPGRGKKRLTYEISIPELGIFIPRRPIAEVADALHSYASTLAEYQIGARAPQGAAVFEVEMRTSGYQSSRKLHIAARAPTEITNAMLFAFGTSPASIRAPLDMSGADFLGHVHAARKRMVRDQREGSSTRRLAIDLISAMQDLKISVTSALRAIEDRDRYTRYTGELSVNAPLLAMFRHASDEEQSNHERRRNQARFRPVLDAIVSVFDAHEVFSKLPDTIEMRIDGEANFLRFELFDPTAPGPDFEKSISETLFEFDRIDELTEKLDQLIAPVDLAQASWVIHLNGDIRSRFDYHLNGPTLSQAIIDHVRQDKRSHASLALVNLETDLLCDAEGKPAKAQVWRIL